MSHERGEGAEHPADGVAWLEIPKAILRGRRTIVAAVALGALLGVVLALALPRTYVSQMTVVPTGSTEPGEVAGGLASLAGQFGFSGVTAGGFPLDFFAKATAARHTLERVALREVRWEDPRTDQGRLAADSIPISQLIGAEGATEAQVLDSAVRTLRDRLLIAVDAESNSLSIGVRADDPEAAFVVLKAISWSLNRTVLDTQQQAATLRSRFLRQQLAALRDSLVAAEDSLRTFYEENRSIGNSPRLQFEERRLTADVDRLRQLRSALEGRLAEADFSASRDVPVLIELDPPFIPVEPSNRRLYVVLIVVGVAFLGSLVWVLVRAWWKEDRERYPQDWREVEVEWNEALSKLRPRR